MDETIIIGLCCTCGGCLLGVVLALLFVYSNTIFCGYCGRKRREAVDEENPAEVTNVPKEMDPAMLRSVKSGNAADFTYRNCGTLTQSDLAVQASQSCPYIPAELSRASMSTNTGAVDLTHKGCGNKSGFLSNAGTAYSIRVPVDLSKCDSLKMGENESHAVDLSRNKFGNKSMSLNTEGVSYSLGVPVDLSMVPESGCSARADEFKRTKKLGEKSLNLKTPGSYSLGVPVDLSMAPESVNSSRAVEFKRTSKLGEKSMNFKTAAGESYSLAVPVDLSMRSFVSGNGGTSHAHDFSHSKMGSKSMNLNMKGGSFSLAADVDLSNVNSLSNLIAERNRSGRAVDFSYKCGDPSMSLGAKSKTYSLGVAADLSNDNYSAQSDPALDEESDSPARLEQSSESNSNSTKNSGNKLETMSVCETIGVGRTRHDTFDSSPRTSSSYGSSRHSEGENMTRRAEGENMTTGKLTEMMKQMDLTNADVSNSIGGLIGAH